MYIVVSKFKDLKDNEHIYNVGDIYPREGINIEDVDSKRIKELSTKKNKIGKVLIQEIEEEKENKEEKENPEVEEKLTEDVANEDKEEK